MCFTLLCIKLKVVAFYKKPYHLNISHLDEKTRQHKDNHKIMSLVATYVYFINSISFIGMGYLKSDFTSYVFSKGSDSIGCEVARQNTECSVRLESK